MNILVPMAGTDQFFRPDEFFFPKPLVEIAGRPMIELVIENLRAGLPEARFIFVVKAADAARFSLESVVRLAAGGHAEVVRLDADTQGALCTCLMAAGAIDPEAPLVLSNADHILDGGWGAPFAALSASGADGGVVTFDSVHPRWSYVERDPHSGLVVEAAEKRVISRRAIAGFYYYARGRHFLEAAHRAILNGATTNGHFYISATLNEMILAGQRVIDVPVPAARYHSFYSPHKVAEYERGLQPRGQPDIADAGPPTLVIPMAGQGQRFADRGYTLPKPFIDVAGAPMIERVLDNLAVPGARVVLLARAEHLEAAPLLAARLAARPGVTIQRVDRATEGAACTVLLARAHFDGDRPLLIANCDQIIDARIADFLADAAARNLDGSILVFRDPQRDRKWSFAKTGPGGLVQQVREKEPISDLATVGLYYFRRGHDFVAAAADMIARNERVNGEFYTCPVYNHAIAAGLRIGVFEIPAGAMHGIGTPEDLEAFLARAHAARRLPGGSDAA